MLLPEIPDIYIEKSPLFRMHTMKTPTLIMFGTRDTSEQGWEHFRAMQQAGVAPVRFILFPGAGHGPTKLSHRKRKMNEELAWIDRYLLGEEKEINEAFDEMSPLAYGLKKAEAKRSGHLLGELVNDASGGVLVPETAEFEGPARLGIILAVRQELIYSFLLHSYRDLNVIVSRKSVLTTRQIVQAYLFSVIFLAAIVDYTSIDYHTLLDLDVKLFLVNRAISHMNVLNHFASGNAKDSRKPVCQNRIAISKLI